MSPAERKAFAESIRPAVKGQSDKFSWRLYQRVLKRGRERVYIGAWNNILGEAFTPDLDALKAGDRSQIASLMIGEMRAEGWFSGNRLQQVTIPGSRVDESFAYNPAFQTSRWIDITEWFWGTYLRQGRCIIHGHWSHSWLQINRNARKCAYCGLHQHRTVVTKKTIERQEVWAAPGTCP